MEQLRLKHLKRFCSISLNFSFKDGDQKFDNRFVEWWRYNNIVISFVLNIFNKGFVRFRYFQFLTSLGCQHLLTDKINPSGSIYQ